MPDIDTTYKLDDALMNWYQQIIDILRCSCELSHIKMFLEVSNLSYFCCMLLFGEFYSASNIFMYFKIHMN